MRPRSAIVPQMAVALCRGGSGRSTRHRARPRRHDDGNIWMRLGNRLADLVLIVDTVGGEGGNGVGDLAEGSGRRARHRAHPRRHDDGNIWMRLSNRLADLVLIVDTVGGEGGNGDEPPASRQAR